MKATVRTGLTAEGVWAGVSRRLRSRAQTAVRGEGPFTLVTFGSVAVVLSRMVRKPLRRIGDTREQIVAVAINFSADARELLAERGALVIEHGDFHWTDDRYVRIRQGLGGSRVPDPVGEQPEPDTGGTDLPASGS